MNSVIAIVSNTNTATSAIVSCILIIFANINYRGDDIKMNNVNRSSSIIGRIILCDMCL
jgi:hypothetical protein